LNTGLPVRHRKLAALLAVSLAILLVLTGCPPPESENPAESGLTAESQSLFGFIPDDDYCILSYIDLEKFIDSEFGRRIIEFSPTYNVWNEKLGVGMDAVERLAIAAKYTEGSKTDGEAIILMWGQPDEEWIFNRLGRKREFFKKEEVEGAKLYTLEDFAFVLLNKKLLAIGTPKILRESLRLAKGKGRSLAEGKGLSKFQEYLRHGDSFWLAIDQIDRIIKPLAERESLLKGFVTLRSGLLAVAFEKDALFRVQVTCSSEEDASQIASSLMTLIGLLNFFIKNADFDDLPEALEPQDLRRNLVSMLDSVNVENSGALVNFNFKVPNEIIDYLAQVTKSIVDKKNTD